MKKLFITLSLLFVMFSVSAQESKYYICVGSCIDRFGYKSPKGDWEGVYPQKGVLVSEICSPKNETPYIILTTLDYPTTRIKIFLHNGLEVDYEGFVNTYVVTGCFDNYLELSPVLEK